MSNTPLLWQPSENFKSDSNLHAYMAWLNKEKHLHFQNYEQLWQWSTTEIADFWESLWQYFHIIDHSENGYDRVLSEGKMPNVRWFEGAKINYAEHIFRQKTILRPALYFQSETEKLYPISWQELEEKTAQFADFLRQQGVKCGDRVVGFLPEIPEATIAFLATISLGAVWSSCSPDFGTSSIVDRFFQIEPSVLIAVDGYQYNGKPFPKNEVLNDIIEALPTLKKTVVIPYLNKDLAIKTIKKEAILWRNALEIGKNNTILTFEAVEFSHPIWVLYSSGTTGVPKAITHSQGGVLLEHLKYLTFHNDIQEGDNFFWFSTTGWMMWNYTNAALLAGASLVLYDGSPSFPNMGVLWEMTEKAKIHHFGTSAPYLVACMKADLNPAKDYDLRSLRSLSSTGSPLPPDAFGYVYDKIKSDIWLVSMSGGTDVCTAFVGGNPLLNLHEGEIQCRALGCKMLSFNELGEEVNNEVGEMVVTEPMPSMPIYFWNDPTGEKYLGSYFEMYEGIWRHGDWLKITERNSLIIFGRSDATLNRQGVRIGTAEIYRVMDKIVELKDSLILNLELTGGKHFMPLFVMLQENQILTDELKQKINVALKSEYSPRHVPDEIIAVVDIPYTISGKKMEAPVKKILMGIPLQKAVNVDSMRNPEAVQFFIQYAQQFEGQRGI